MTNIVREAARAGEEAAGLVEGGAAAVEDQVVVAADLVDDHAAAGRTFAPSG